jgi:competence protein ComFC
LLKEFIQLIYPDFCSGCNQPLLFSERAVCSSCLMEVKSSFASDSNTFFGRYSVNREIYAFKFFKNKLLQKMIYEMKYNGNKDTAFVLGVELGFLVQNVCKSKNQDFDFIIPVPVSEIKKQARGYNQSEYIANGISQVIKRPVLKNRLQRRNNLRSQVNKSRYNRWSNVDEQYYLARNFNGINKILLVDDVVTTGATINSCIRALQTINNLEISIAALAGNK